MRQIPRLVENNILRALNAFPVVYIAGPRQAGKTTLVKHIANSKHKASYLTFDDIQLRASVQKDPEFFLRSIEGSVVLDEIQMVPELFRPLKILVDENRHSKNRGVGKFLLTGSASVMALPQLSNALVGRMALHTLLPLAALELKPMKRTFIDNAFDKTWKFGQLQANQWTKKLVSASFPELLQLKNHLLKNEWCHGYINTILQRDVQALMEVEKIGALPDMLRLLATRTGGLLNESSLSRDTQLNHITAKRYRILLENLFLTLTIPPWSNNSGKRLIKAPKVYLYDLNLLAYLLNVNLLELVQNNHMLFGQVLENFVAIELTKQITFSNIRAKLYHYRTSSGQEVDFILEGSENKIVGIEVKGRSKITNKDFIHLEALKKDLGQQFHSGFVLYQGNEILPFGKDMWALPLTILWE